MVPEGLYNPFDYSFSLAGYPFRFKSISEESLKRPQITYSLEPKRIVKNGPALIIFWDDDTKTIVKRKKGEKDDIYHAFCAALAKRIYGSNSQIKKYVDSVIDETKKKG